MRSVIPRPNSFWAPNEEEVQSAPTVDEHFSKEHLLDGCVEDKGEMPCVGNVRPLVGPTEGDGDLGPWAIAGIGGSVFRSDDEHPAGGELPFSSALSGGKAPKDGGDHLVMILEGIVIAPRWSASTVPVGIVI